MSATISANLRELLLHVVAHGYAYFRQICESFLEIVGKALCGGAYCIYVHTVAAGTHNATEAACTEFKGLYRTIR